MEHLVLWVVWWGFFFPFFQMFSVSLSLPWFPRKHLQVRMRLILQALCKIGSLFCLCLNVMNTESKYLVI